MHRNQPQPGDLYLDVLSLDNQLLVEGVGEYPYDHPYKSENNQFNKINLDEHVTLERNQPDHPHGIQKANRGHWLNM